MDVERFYGDLRDCLEPFGVEAGCEQFDDGIGCRGGLRWCGRVIHSERFYWHDQLGMSAADIGKQILASIFDRVREHVTADIPHLVAGNSR